MPTFRSRSLLLPLALALAVPAAMAQSADKDAPAAPKQGTAKSSSTKPSAASKRLDFVPSSNVKPTTTRQTAPASPTPAEPSKHDWHCDGATADA